MTSADMGGAGGAAHQAVTSLPAGFTQTDIGGFKLGGKVEGGGGSFGGSIGGSAGSGGGGSGGGANGDCGNVLLGVVRDFKGADEAGGHADFETPKIYGGDVTLDLVSAALGLDKKPIYTSKCEIGNPGPMATCPFGAETTTQANFDQWYRDTPGVNEAYTVSIYLAPRMGGLFTFQSLAYFPVDGAGFMGSAKADDGLNHNFGFTTELHTQFLYSGGETFNFQGDDDVWVYINGKLAVDLGGLHPMQTRNVALDAAAATLGIVKGTIYSLDLFHAERHTTASTFRIDTNLSFTDCGTVIPGKVK
jgi:fibro-slime domain-containing protein